MPQASKRRHAPSAARRGQIVQRVIVDGWTTARTAEIFELPPYLVEIWVADYRRRGMASLRRIPWRTRAVEIVALQLCRPAAALLHRLAHRLAARRPPAAPATPPSSQDDRRGGGS